MDHKQKQLPEQIQEDLITLLDGQVDDETVITACQIVVDRFKEQLVEAARFLDKQMENKILSLFVGEDTRKPLS